jgi:hypothetical protein
MRVCLRSQGGERSANFAGKKSSLAGEALAQLGQGKQVTRDLDDQFLFTQKDGSSAFVVLILQPEFVDKEEENSSRQL